MKALVKKERTPGLWLEDVPIPELKDNEVRIKVKKSAICGTDIHIYNWDEWAQKTVPVPMVVGHEFMGEIVEVGKNVKDFHVGQRVTGEGHLTCGTCIKCQSGQRHLCPNTLGIGYDCPGNFAEYFNLTAENVFPLPDFIKDDWGAIFDPFGNAVHASLAFDLTGEDILITGAGPIGLMSALIACHAGARHVVITDLLDYRIDLASKIGIPDVINVKNTDLKKAVKDLGIEEGFTVGLEMSGNAKAFNSLLELMQHGGKVSLLGILPPNTTIDWNLVIFNMLTIKGIYGRKIFSTWYKMTHLLEGGINLDPLITHRFPIDEFQKGFDVMLSGQSGKVILDWV